MKQENEEPLFEDFGFIWWIQFAIYLIGFCMAFAIVLWPVFAIIAICYYMFQYPIDCIKKNNGIK